MIRLQTNHRRGGFSLTEVLVVIGVISLLMAVSVGVLRNAVGLARQRQTEATILKIHGLVQQRVEAFHRAVDRLNLTASKQKLKLNFNQTYGNATNVYLYDNSKVLDVLVKKQLFQSRFPQNFSERNLSSSSTLPPPTPHNPNTQSAALLYWLLTNSEVFGVPPVDEGEFSSSEVQDTDGDGLSEFVDGWGRPLRFYRCPTQLFRPGIKQGTGAGALTSTNLASIDRDYVRTVWSGLPAHPPEDINGNGVLDAGEDLNGNGQLDNYDIDPLVRDPDDPTSQMYLVASSDSSGTIMAGFQNLFNTPATFNAFLIISAGPDGVLGMHEPFDYLGTSDPTQAAPTTTTTWPSLGIPMMTTPALGGSQGRLGAIDTSTTTDLKIHPINDNISNRKR